MSEESKNFYSDYQKLFNKLDQDWHNYMISMNQFASANEATWLEFLNYNQNNLESLQKYATDYINRILEEKKQLMQALDIEKKKTDDFKNYPRRS